MIYYLQIRSDNVITDAIEYEYDSYIRFETNEPLPIGLIGGWWKLIDGKLIEDLELNPNTIDNKIKTAIDDYTISLIEGGIL